MTKKMAKSQVSVHSVIDPFSYNPGEANPLLLIYISRETNHPAAEKNAAEADESFRVVSLANNRARTCQT